MILYPSPNVVVALDFDSADKARQLVAQLDPQHCRLKIGKQLFTLAGPELVREFQEAGFSVFLDLKYHDIPTTVAKACAAAAELGVWMVNVHALGGFSMMKAAREAINQTAFNKPLLIAVTLLTSLTAADCEILGLQGSPETIVLRLATLAYEAGLDGVVCSPQEVTLLRQTFGPDFCLVVPGIRSAQDPSSDQQRTASAQEALSAGAHYLVIGRPITQSENPKEALKKIF